MGDVTNPTTLNDLLTVFTPLFSSGFVLYLIKRMFDTMHDKVDRSSAKTETNISRIHERIDRYEEAQRLCQLNLHQHFASKTELERLDAKTDANSERIVAVETTLYQKKGM